MSSNAESENPVETNSDSFSTSQYFVYYDPQGAHAARQQHFAMNNPYYPRYQNYPTHRIHYHPHQPHPHQYHVYYHARNPPNHRERHRTPDIEVANVNDYTDYEGYRPIHYREHCRNKRRPTVQQNNKIVHAQKANAQKTYVQSYDPDKKAEAPKNFDPYTGELLNANYVAPKNAYVPYTYDPKTGEFMKPKRTNLLPYVKV